MYIKEFQINNFRGYRNFTILSNKNSNVITGVNNSGKTTILEAISLWNEIISILLKIAKRKDDSCNLRNGDYRIGNKSVNYLDYRQINSVRGFGYKDLFFNLDTELQISLTAKIQVNVTTEIEIGFVIHKASGSNYNVYLSNHDVFDFTQFNTLFTNLPESIGCYFSSPVATIAAFEEFETIPKIKEAVKARESSKYFRNRLFELSKRENFSDFKQDLSQILYNTPNQIDFIIKGDKSKDVNISIEVNLKSSSYKNISLLGSGTIQIIEILLHVYDIRRQLNIILLDEPDSHIHRDIQKRLLKYLNNTGVQIFLTTHNESLIRSANPNDLFFVDESVSNESATIIKPIGQERLPARKIGIEASHHSKLINLIGSESSLDILNALEADKVLFVEGVDDSEYIQQLCNLKDITKECVYWSFGGIDNLISRINNYKEFFNSLGCNQSIWDKCSIIVDADFLTDQQKANLNTQLRNKLGIPVFIWNSYTIESTILTDIPKLINIISTICIAQEVTKTPQEISDCVRNKYLELIAAKKDDIESSEEFSKRVTGQLEARINNLDNNLSISRRRVFEEVTVPNLFNHFRLFSNSKFDAEIVDHITNKDDIEEFLDKILLDLSIHRNEEFENNFSFILSHLSNSTINNEWERLVNFINE